MYIYVFGNQALLIQHRSSACRKISDSKEVVHVSGSSMNILRLMIIQETISEGNLLRIWYIVFLLLSMPVSRGA